VKAHFFKKGVLQMRTFSLPPLLLDFDGIWCHSVPEQHRAVSVMLSKIGVTPGSFQNFRNMTRFMDWLYEHDITLDRHELHRLYWVEYKAENCLIMPGAREVFTTLAQSRNLVVISSALDSYVRGRIAAFGIEHLLTEVHCGQDKKVQTIEGVCSRFNVHPLEVFFVGDMRSDVDCGREAGVQTVLLADQDSPHGTFANKHITDIRQLLDIVR
jgi:phosphoglycolate phosphatase-like HAD superfamily hydrolase